MIYISNFLNISYLYYCIYNVIRQKKLSFIYVTDIYSDGDISWKISISLTIQHARGGEKLYCSYLPEQGS